VDNLVDTYKRHGWSTEAEELGMPVKRKSFRGGEFGDIDSVDILARTHGNQGWLKEAENPAGAFRQHIYTKQGRHVKGCLERTILALWLRLLFAEGLDIAVRAMRGARGHFDFEHSVQPVPDNQKSSMSNAARQPEPELETWFSQRVSICQSL
jgi:hypothetical protein